MEFRKRNFSHHRRIRSLGRRLVLSCLVLILSPLFAYLIYVGLNLDSTKVDAQSAYDWSDDPNWQVDNLDTSSSGWQASSSDSSSYRLGGNLTLNHTDSPGGSLNDLATPGSVSNLANQAPFFVIGKGGGSVNSSGSGFYRDRMFMDVWIPFDDPLNPGNENTINNYIIDTYDLCHGSPLDTGPTTSNVDLEINLVGRPIFQRNDLATIWKESRNDRAQCRDEMRLDTPRIPAISNADNYVIEEKELLDKLNPSNVKKYKKYTLSVRAKFPAVYPSSYYNAFRLRIRLDDSGVTDYNTANSAIDVYSILGKSVRDTIASDYQNNQDLVDAAGNEGLTHNRYLGFSKDDNYGYNIGNVIQEPFGANRDRMLMWEASFLIAPDVTEYECLSSEEVFGYIGIFDSDRSEDPGSGNLTGYPGYQKIQTIEMKADIMSMDRDDYMSGGTTWNSEATLTFDGKLNDNDVGRGVVMERTSSRVSDDYLEDGSGYSDSGEHAGVDWRRIWKGTYYTYEDKPYDDADYYSGDPSGIVWDQAGLKGYYSNGGIYETNRHLFYKKTNSGGTVFGYDRQPYFVDLKRQEISQLGIKRNPTSGAGSSASNPITPNSAQNTHWTAGGNTGHDNLASTNLLLPPGNYTNLYGNTIASYGTGLNYLGSTNEGVDTFVDRWKRHMERKNAGTGITDIKFWDGAVDNYGNEFIIDTSSNQWEDKLYSFSAGKVYKIRFYNIDARNFVQLRTPFDYVNTIQNCEAEAVINITNECELYIKNLFWEDEPNVKLELKLIDKRNPSTYISQVPYQSLVNPSAPTVFRPIESWYDQVDPPANSPNPNNLIKELVYPSELLYSLLLDNDFENYAFVLTGRYATDPNNPATIIDGDANGTLKEKVIPITPDNNTILPRDHNDCLGYKAKISARDCKIRWEELNITLPGGVRPDLHFEVLEGSTRVTQITYTNRGPDILGVRIDQPNLNSTLEITDLTNADATWFARAPGFTFKITGYYDDNNTPGDLTDDVLRQFQTTDAHGNIVIIIPNIDTSDYYPNLPINNLSCTPKTTPCSVTPPIDVSNMVALTTFGAEIRDFSTNGEKKNGGATFDHGHDVWMWVDYEEFWDDDNDPDTPAVPRTVPKWEEVHVPDFHPDLPYIAGEPLIDDAQITHSGWRSPTESEMEALIRKNLINGVHGTDTVTTLTGNSRDVELGVGLQNFRPWEYQISGPLWELNSANLVDIQFRNGDGGGGFSTTGYRFYIKSVKVTPAGEPSNVLEHRTGILGGNFSLNDPRQFLRSTIQTYEWEMEWQLDMWEVLRYHWSWSNWDIEWNPHPNNLGYIGKVVAGASTRIVSLEGQLNTCSRTMVVQMPECTVINLPTTILPTTKREKFDTDNNGTLETTIVHPVGKAEGRSVLKLVNPNVFGLRTTAANHPEYSITGDPFLSAPYYNGNPNLSNSTLDIISSVPPGGSKEYDEWPTAINLPGKYLITWTPRWQTDGRGYGVWDGREHVDTVCFGQNSTFIFVWADPPLCRVEYTIFEVGDTDTEITVTLSNPNLAPMDIQSVQYTIDRNGSNPPNNRTGNALLPPHLNPILIGAKNTATGHVILKSTKQAISENGIYDFDWSINTSMGNERWTTLDFPQTPPQQNSWFENPNERITTTGPTGTIECKQKMRIAVRPYLKVFYGDVSAGGYFGLNEDYDACGDDNVIRTWTSTASGEPDGYIAAHGEGSNGGDAKGASVRHGIQAYDLVAGFYSSSQRNSLPQPLKGLTLNNVGLDDYDGGFGKPNCVGNYWREVSELPEEENLTNNNIEINLNSDLQDNDRRRYVLKNNQNLIIKSNNTSLGDLKATLFVEGQGNVYIENDIINNDAASWDDPSQIGYITIITRGNIYINPSVRKVDAVLVAYPKQYDDAVTGSTIAYGGEIWTCYFDGITAATHFNRCNNPLVVNGALIAQKVRLGRIYKSVKEATGTPEYDHNNSSSEMVNLLPEYLLGIPELPIFPDQIYKSDSISVHPVNF